jgi:hypothetical protein
MPPQGGETLEGSPAMLKRALPGQILVSGMRAASGLVVRPVFEQHEMGADRRHAAATDVADDLPLRP